jgi:inner centromere protein
MDATYDAPNKDALNSTYNLNSTYDANSTAAVKKQPQLQSAASTDVSTYDITPARHELPPEELADPENYNIADLKSDEDTDDEDDPRKKIPSWANGESL